MNRRTFLISAATMSSVGVINFTPFAKFAFAATPPIDAITAIKNLRIHAGSYTGGYLIAPAGKLNWYFANLGLSAILPYLSVPDLETYIRPYLNLYLAKREANATIQDVVFQNGDPTKTATKLLSDSDDSYAATFLTLASLYVKASQNWTWWNTNKAVLKTIAYNNITLRVKKNGLTSVFQTRGRTGYLMDNCEVYRGLRDFAAILRSNADNDANYYDNFANTIISGIKNNLYDNLNNAFISNDTLFAAGTNFYNGDAGATCQIFPQAYGLVELSSYFTNGWNYLNKIAPNWQDGRYDPYPWAILGYVAAQRGAITQAQNQVQMIENLFVTNQALVTINELGYYHKTKAILVAKA